MRSCRDCVPVGHHDTHCGVHLGGPVRHTRVSGAGGPRTGPRRRPRVGPTPGPRRADPCAGPPSSCSQLEALSPGSTLSPVSTPSPGSPARAGREFDGQQGAVDDVAGPPSACSEPTCHPVTGRHLAGVGDVRPPFPSRWVRQASRAGGRSSQSSYDRWLWLSGWPASAEAGALATVRSVDRTGTWTDAGRQPPNGAGVLGRSVGGRTDRPRGGAGAAPSPPPESLVRLHAMAATVPRSVLMAVHLPTIRVPTFGPDVSMPALGGQTPHWWATGVRVGTAPGSPPDREACRSVLDPLRATTAGTRHGPVVDRGRATGPFSW